MQADSLHFEMEASSGSVLGAVIAPSGGAAHQGRGRLAELA